MKSWYSNRSCSTAEYSNRTITTALVQHRMYYLSALTFISKVEMYHSGCSSHSLHLRSFRRWRCTARGARRILCTYVPGEVEMYRSGCWSYSLHLRSWRRWRCTARGAGRILCTYVPGEGGDVPIGVLVVFSALTFLAKVEMYRSGCWSYSTASNCPESRFTR